MKMNAWLKLNQDVEAVSSRKNGTITVSLFASPYDVPQAVRGYFDGKSEKFIVEFSYIEDEPVRPEWIEDGTEVFIGNKSSRLYRIEVARRAVEKGNPADRKMEALRGQLNHAIEKLGESNGAYREENYKLTREAISQRANDMFDLETLRRVGSPGLLV